MKRILLLAMSAFCIPAFGLPTYEPFTEFATNIYTNGSNFVATTLTGASIGNSSGSVLDAIDLTTGQYTAPSGEIWSNLNFNGQSGIASTTNNHGLNVYVISNTAIFPASALSGLLPATFPGYPAAGGAITNFVENPAQPLVNNAENSSTVGNSAVLRFSQDITRPTSGTKTLFVSYLISVAQQGALGAGNEGRFLSFLSVSNLYEGSNTTGAYVNWAQMFNIFTNTGQPTVPTNRYAGHGLLENSGTAAYFGPCDSYKGLEFTTSPYKITMGVNGSTLGTPAFVVGEYVFTSGSLKDTNLVWVNPTAFGGPTPAANPAVDVMPFNMGDIAGLCLENRVGSGGAGGVGTNYIANLLIGTTWSYVTGGPEFTTPLVNTTNSSNTLSLTAAAVAASQSVTYQWQQVTATATNNLSNGSPVPGGAAIVSGATTGTLTLTGLTPADTNGTFQIVATASGTGYTLASPANVFFDPAITSQPQGVFTTPGGTAVFSLGATTQVGPLTYRWMMSGTNLSDGTLNDGSVISGSGTSTLTINNASKLENNDLISCGVTNADGSGQVSASVALITTDPAITAPPQPTSTNVNFGGQFSFTASALTAPANEPLTYSWYNGSTMIVNGTQADGSVATGAQGTSSGNTLTSTLTLSNVSWLDDGSYVLVVSNSQGSVATSAVATVTVNDPILASQVPSQVEVGVNGNTSITFGVRGTGVSYQWYTNGGTPLANAGDFSGVTNSTLTITGAQPGDAGVYYVVATGTDPINPAIQSANLTVYVDTAITGITVSPTNLVQQAGTHLAFAATVTGGTSGLVYYNWQHNGANLANGTLSDGTIVSGSTTPTLVLANIHTNESGAYTLVASNAAAVFTSSTNSLTVSASLLALSANNLVVARVGDNAQNLSSTTGNTLYLDQYTTNGVYVDTIQVPDATTGAQYDVGSAASVIGSPAILVSGAGTDTAQEGYLTRSYNQQYLCFAGYCVNYPFNGSGSFNQGGTLFSRGLGEVNAFGYYSLAYTNEGLYSGGNQLIHGMTTLEGTNFWVTGEAGSAGVKFVNSTVTSYASGSGIPVVTASDTGPQVVQTVSFGTYSNLVFSDLAAATHGLYAYTNNSFPEPVPSGTSGTSLLIGEGGLPTDFAFSPDGNTVYIADAGTFATNNGAGGGGIERWDTNSANGGYSWSYTLQVMPGASAPTNGAQGLTVVFPTNITSWGSNVTGAILYATSLGASGNSLISVVDTGSNSAPELLATAASSQALRGVRFGPIPVPLSFYATPQAFTGYAGQSDTLSVGAAGDGPIFYQWQFDGTNIAGATNSTLPFIPLAGSNTGTYTVIVTNFISSNSFTTTVTAQNTAPIVSTVPQSRVETAGDHLAFTVSAVGNPPLGYQWRYNGANITGATSTSISLTNIVLTNSGTYSVVVSNPLGTNTNNATLLVTSGLQALSSNNIVVARVGDGVQGLSGSTGNTLYLDQFTQGGGYSNTIMIPDNRASGNLIASGGAAEALQNTTLSLSANSNTFLNFAGFSTNYPAAAGLAGTNALRAFGAVNAFGFYSEPLTAFTLYDAGGDDFLNCALSLDGFGEFWTTGTAGSPPAVKYVVPATSGAAGGIAALAGSATGTRVIQAISGNLVYSDAGATPAGIYAVSGEPTGATGSAALVVDAVGNPDDFAVSPDITSTSPNSGTVYVCDSSPASSGGGIQRYDWNSTSGAFVLSYTLGTGSTSGGGCLAVNFNANSTWGPGVNGAVIYATTSGSPGNSLIEIVDNGPSSSPTVIETANQNQVLRGVRFGPVVQPPVIASQPQAENAFVGGTATFTVAAQNGPITGYQWQLNGTNLTNGLNISGSGSIISGATNATLTVANVSPLDDQGSYTVLVFNPDTNGAALSSPAVLTVPVEITTYPVSFESVTNGGTAVFTVVATGGTPGGTNLTYQWSGPCGPMTDGPNSCNGSTATISGSSSATLTIANVGSADSGSYYVTVTSANTTSADSQSQQSTLDVYTGPPMIITDIQPTSLVLPVGSSASFTVQVAGSTPLAYQWLLNGANVSNNGRISGAQSGTLTIVNAQISDTGSYQLFVTNSAGTNYSSVATLTVTLIGFNNGSDWSVNGNGHGNFSGNVLTLTDGGTSETSSAFFSNQVDVLGFLASWTYQVNGGSPPSGAVADGTAFVLQNAPAGVTAIGGGGGDLGYVTVTDSVAFEFNIFTSYTVGIAIGTNGLGSNGTTSVVGGPYVQPLPILLTNGDPIGVTLTYLNGVASMVLTDAVTSASFTTNYHLNVPGILGSNAAYVGFTGASGGVGGEQTVSNFFFSSIPSVSAQKAAGGTLVLTWPVTAAGFQLQQTSSLSNPNWTAVTNVPVVVGQENQVIVTPTGSAQYYRLVIQ